MNKPPTPSASLYFIVYVSSASSPFSQAQLIELLSAIRVSNDKLGVTGMLLYNDGSFLQMLEGPREVLAKLSARIERDPRHCSMRVLMEGPLTTRSFGSWSMAFRDLTGSESNHVPNFSEFLKDRSQPMEGARWPHKAQRLLLSFRDAQMGKTA